MPSTYLRLGSMRNFGGAEERTCFEQSFGLRTGKSTKTNAACVWAAYKVFLAELSKQKIMDARGV